METFILIFLIGIGVSFFIINDVIKKYLSIEKSIQKTPRKIQEKLGSRREPDSTAIAIELDKESSPFLFTEKDELSVARYIFDKNKIDITDRQNRTAFSHQQSPEIRLLLLEYGLKPTIEDMIHIIKPYLKSMLKQDCFYFYIPINSNGDDYRLLKGLLRYLPSKGIIGFITPMYIHEIKYSNPILVLCFNQITYYENQYIELYRRKFHYELENKFIYIKYDP